MAYPVPMNEAGALVLGADYRSLGICRSLGRRGITAWVAVEFDDDLATHSKFVRRTVPWPGVFDTDQTEFLLHLAEDEGIKGWVLFPTGDKSADFVSRHHADLEQAYRLTTPPHASYDAAQDKRQVYARAQALGIAVPSTWYTDSVDEAAALDLEYPVILKPATGAITNPISDTKVWFVEDRDAMLARYAEAAEVMHSGHVMIQEIIPGGGEHQLSYAAACRKGDPVAFLTARRTRQIPVDFGRASTFVETYDIPEIIEPSEQVIADLALEGLVEVEFKRDPRNGLVKLLDVNARAWGWHSIGAPAGVDFPYLAWLVAQGEPVEPAVGRPGVRWVRLTTDLPTSAKEIAGRRMKLGSYLRSLRPPLEGPIAAKDDPKPALMELPVLVKRMLGKPQMLRRLVGKKVGKAV